MPRSLTIYRPWPWKFAGSRGGDGLAGRAGTVTLARAVRDSRGALARPGVIKVAVIRPAAAAKVSLRHNRVDVISPPPQVLRMARNLGCAPAAAPWSCPGGTPKIRQAHRAPRRSAVHMPPSQASLIQEAQARRKNINFRAAQSATNDLAGREC
jgi:hypothetical protein